jgi:hypothetical protein
VLGQMRWAMRGRGRQSGAFQPSMAVKRRLRSPLVCGEGDFLLPKPVRGAKLPSKLPESDECRIKGFSRRRMFSVSWLKIGEASVCGTRLPPPLAPRNSS